MGSSVSHCDRANKNDKTMQCLRDNNVNRMHNDWIIPIACYKAFHLVEAFCDSVGKHFTSHNERLNFIKHRQEFTTPHNDGVDIYKSVYTLTYLCVHAMNIHDGIFSEPSVKWKKYFDGAMETEIIQTHLRRIESFARNCGIETISEQRH
jgi:hypothetical protein